jgi:hypothetical protein
MSIVRKRNGNFTVINNSIVNDERLSMEAVGLLTWLLSKPDNWRVVQSHISAVFKVGKDKTYRVLRELIDCGYLTKTVERGGDGGFSGISYVLYDNPPENNDISPLPAFPDAVNPDAVNPPLVKTKSNKNLEAVKTEGLFESFWSQYPNKTAKAYALKLFNRQSLQDQKAIVDSMPKFLESLTEKRKTFKDYQPPNPSTYINQRRFDDFKADPVDWQKVLTAARRLDAWSPAKWGPPPGTAGCVVPKELLTSQDNRAWKEWRPGQ